MTVLGWKQEVEVSAVRSSGPGGQNVNKISSKIQLRLNIPSSTFFNEDQKKRISLFYAHRLTKNGDLIVTASEERNRSQNEKMAFQKLEHLLAVALRVQKKRKKTRPSYSSQEARILSKKKHSETKRNRSVPED